MTVIATGFGPARLDVAAGAEEPALEERASRGRRQREQPEEAFEVSDDVLEVPSFLRD